VTNQKGGVFQEPADVNNKYNHNFQNRFCNCNCDYDAQKQKGTMFQCLGLGTAEEGGCGEDWYHTGCIVGLGPDWYKDQDFYKKKHSGPLETITEDARIGTDNENGESGQVEDGEEEAEDMPHAPGFPEEDEFQGFICHKCVDAFPWIKRYAGTQGFLPPVFKRSAAPSPESQLRMKTNPAETKAAAEIFAAPIPLLNGPQKEATEDGAASPLPNKQSEQAVDPIELKTASETFTLPESISKKRKAEDEEEDLTPSKRVKEDEIDVDRKAIPTDTTGTLDKLATSEIVADPACKYEQLPPAPEGPISLFFKSDFLERFCHCSNCFPRLAKHPQLLEEEDTYTPPVSSDGEGGDGSTVGSGSLLDRGERALTNVDRVRAIEGVMAYNHLKEKLKPFFKEFAESGKAISAEDIKAHFAKIRGDEEAIKQAGEAAASNADNRREQSGY
jgi:E3 ubiquitin-protein ligase UBR7